MNEVVIDRRAFDEAMRRFSAESGLAAHDVLRDQMRLAVSACVKATPPSRRRYKTADGIIIKVAKGDTEADHAIGVKSITTDVTRVLGKIDNKGTLARLDEQFGRRFHPLQFPEPNLSQARSHVNRFRNKKGRVGKQWIAKTVVLNGGQAWSQKMHTTTRVRNQVIREKVDKLGQMKAGWAAGAAMFGVSLPGWITKHAIKGGSADTFKEGSDAWYLEISSNAPHIGFHQGILKSAINGRVRAMKTRLEKELFRLAKKHSAK
jgi:hypothetical protein